MSTIPSKYQQEDLLTNEMELSPLVLQNLLASARWGKFLAIVGFISCVLMLLGALVFSMSTPSSRAYSNPYNTTALIMTVYIVLAILFFVPCLFLYRFSVKMIDASKNSSQESLETAFGNLKALFRFMGIITIITLIFYALAILVLAIGMNMR